ncbi:MAG: cupin domain-containing protein, partial [Gemmatimonadetes bacterium]|nr:cupin domain-containing protein [Gemmatimonadota bacterium]
THKTLGISTIDFKVTSADSGGAMLVIENTNRSKGGPARHLHVDQDELFYVIEGEYAIEVGGERFALRSGDSILAPRQVPRVGICGGDVRTPPHHVHAAGEDGGVLSRGLEDQRNADAGSAAVARTRHGAVRAAAQGLTDRRRPAPPATPGCRRRLAGAVTLAGTPRHPFA